MPQFLELLPPDEALKVLLGSLSERQTRPEEVRLEQAVGRITAQAIYAIEALPAFARATVDGYAVLAEDTFGSSDSLPAYLTVCGEVPMGAEPAFTIQPAQAALIHTGGMLPAGANAVVMVEYTQVSRPGEIEVLRAVAPGENILKAGEDVQPGEEVVAQGVRLRPAEIGGLMALGITRVLAAARPRVGIISSGDEVVPPESVPGVGQVRDVNSYSLSALVEEAGGQPVRYGIVPDRAEAMVETMRLALKECDLVIVTAGSSASVRDLTADVINASGKPGVLVHGVNVRPGKPTILAVCDGKPVIGLPGNPVSALVIARLFVRPVIRRLQGERHSAEGVLQARLAINVASQAGREDWLPVQIRQMDGELMAEPVFFKSNLIFMLARADGLVRIPADANGLAAGEIVDVWLI